MKAAETDINFPLYADVILPLYLNKAYTYFVPDNYKYTIGIGKRVVVQFGSRKIYSAIVSKIHNNKPQEYSVKEIIDVLDDMPVVTPNQLAFWYWMADYYCCSIGEVMAAAMPSGLKLESESKIILNHTFHGDYSILNEQEYIVVQALRNLLELTVAKIQDLLGKKNIFKIVKSLYQKGVILPREDLVDLYEPKTINLIELNPEYSGENAIRSVYETLKKATKQQDVLLTFQMLSRDKKNVSKKEILSKIPGSGNALTELIRKNILIQKNVTIDRLDDELPGKTVFELQDFQQDAFNDIKKQFEDKNVVLLHGITSSGKTHIYIRLIEEYIAQGRQVLYLVPEIALTAQLIRRLRSCFSKKIGIYHSKFSANERYEIWHKTLTGEYSVVLGVRSAIFLPFNDLGLIVVDEEHENSYKQQDPAPRYQARDSAIYMASVFKIKVLLGTATPSLESYYNVVRKKFGYINISKRYENVIPPQMGVTDLRTDIRKKQMKGHLGELLFNEISQTVKAGEQVILFQNRRGYAPYIECQDCGWIPKCKYCDVSLTYHKSLKKLNCHYCGYNQALPLKCAACNGNNLKMKGFGTEKIEDDLEILFPEIRIIRMDLDTTRTRRSYEKIISDFENQEAQILVGTQMVTKGLDFENVKLVGILSADNILQYPDFRSTERCFQLISQVGGRAGRRKKQGRVIIQTFNPSHVVFDFITRNDFTGFFNYEMNERVNLNYPPYSRLVKVVMKHKSLEVLIEASNKYSDKLRSVLGKRLLGPDFPSSMKLKNEFIIQLFVKFENNINTITKGKEIIMNEISAFHLNEKYKSVRFIIDVDPY